MKLFLSTVLLATACNASAHSDCDVDLEGGVRVEQHMVEFSKDKRAIYRIENDQTLFINNEIVNLNNEQQALVSQYSTDVKAIVPQVKGIAVSAIDLAIDGVNMAFNELLGEGNDVSSDLTEQLSSIRNDIEHKFSTEQGFYIDEDGFEGDEVFGEEFENKIENAVEQAVEKSLGSLMIALGKEMLFSGGDADAFEARMEAFGEKIETDMELRGEQIEQQGEALCQAIRKLDKLEEQLKAEFEALENVNTITVSGHDSHNI